MNGAKNKIEKYRQDTYKNYIRLCDILPLNTPLSVMIDPANECNFMCVFCPTGDHTLLKSVGRPKGVMKLDLFCKIVDDLTEFPDKLKVLNLYKDGEPFLNKQFIRMIAYAKHKGIADEVQTTTNGSLLTREKAIEVIEAGLDKIRISVEQVSNEGYKKLARTFADYDLIKRNVRNLYNEKIRRNSPIAVHVKILDVNLTEDEKLTFLKDFNDIADSVNIDTLMGWSNIQKKDFMLGAGVETDMTGIRQIKKNRKVCPEPFKSMAVNFNGQVSICCVDWSMGLIVGDVNKENMVDIWNGKKFDEFRRVHLEGKRSTIEICANCHYILGRGEIADIDNCAGELAKKYDFTR